MSVRTQLQYSMYVFGGENDRATTRNLRNQITEFGSRAPYDDNGDDLRTTLSCTISLAPG